MSEHSRKRSAYAGLLAVDPAKQRPGTPGVYVQDQPDLGVIIIRGLVSDEAFLQRSALALGLNLPRTPSSTVSHEQLTALWISPDEWWILCPASQTNEHINRLNTNLAGLFVQIIDHSSGVGALRLSGGDHLLMSRHLCPYPVENMRIGQCVSTVFPKANVTLARLNTASTLLISRRSYAQWIAELVMRSARPYGLALLPSNHQT